MSWDIVLFNSKQRITSPNVIDPKKLIPTDFCGILEKSFKKIHFDNNHCEITGKDYSIEYMQKEELSSNMLLSLNGEKSLFEMIELAKKYKWQIYDSGIDSMIDLNNPSKNGYMSHKEYISNIISNQKLNSQ